jgi:hypothetical protein
MPSVNLLDLILTLLPGFVAAWVFYGLTAHPRRDMFERVVQALVFTGFVRIIVFPIRELLLWIGASGLTFGTWSEEANFFCSFVVAIPMGCVFAGLANNGTIHEWLQNRDCFLRHRKDDGFDKCWYWTKRTSHPSEWFSAFNEDKRYLTLHLKDGKRLNGWAVEWPDQPDSGHFILQEPFWLDEENNRTELDATIRMLVPVTMVDIVEIMKRPEEVEKDKSRKGTNCNGQQPTSVELA